MWVKKANPNQVFRIISIQSYDSNNTKTEENKSLVLNTISSVGASPFSGHSYYWLQALEKVVKDNRDSFSVLDLKKTLTNGDKRSDNIALGIYLSNEAVDKILEAAKTANKIGH